MFRTSATILLLTAFIVQVFTGQVIRIDYMINTAVYVKNCVNKARPKLHCNGKCQMMKKMNEAEKKEQENPERKYESKEQVISSKSFYASVIPASVTDATSEYFTPDESSIIEMPRSFFHPPSA